MIRKEFQRAIRNHNYELSPGFVYLPAQKIRIGGVFSYELRRKGKLIDEAHAPNLLVDEGLNYFLDVAMSGGTANTAWYIGLFKGNYTPLATDTAANITANATEATEYDEATRVAWSEAGVVAKSITNSASKATFTMNDAVVVYGAFLVSSSTKSGTAGTLAAAARFAASRSLVTTDQLLVTYTLNAAAA